MNTVDLINKLVMEFSQTPRVLVVDDDEKFVILFRHTLEQCGCIVDVTTDTRVAVEKIEYQKTIEKPYDIIFLDLKMPPDHGVYVLSKSRHLVPKTPVVIVTGYPDSDLVNEALKHGYLGLIRKPLDFEEIANLFWKHKISINTPHK